MTESAIDRALAVFRAYEKTGVAGVTTSNPPMKSNRTVTPVTPSASIGVTNNNQATPNFWRPSTPATPITPRRTIAGENANPGSFSYTEVLGVLEGRCPDYVEPSRWQQCIEDAERFIAQWGPQAEALEWSSGDLFALHAPPEQPHPSYRRLSRYDATGLIWILEGRCVVALSSNTAAVAGHTGSIVKHHKIQRYED